MPDTKISDLTSGNPPQDADEFPIRRTTGNNKLSWLNLRTALASLFAGSGAVGSSGITMSTSRLLGRSTAGTGAVEEITLGSNLSLSGTTLNATGGATPGGSSGALQYNNAGALGGFGSFNSGTSATTFPGNVTASGSYLAADGTKTAPAFAFSGATGRGFYRANFTLVFADFGGDIWWTGASNITMRSNGSYGFANGGDATGSPIDVSFSRGGPGILEQRNGNNPQTYRLERAGDGGANRGYTDLRQDATTGFVIDSVNTGTVGAPTNLFDVRGNGTSRVRVATAGLSVTGVSRVIPVPVGSLPSASASGAGAEATVNDALAPAWGATVAGGGAVTVGVRSDGTNWIVF